jgi:hypothetical protein
MLVLASTLKRNLTGEGSETIFSDITTSAWTAAWGDDGLLHIEFVDDLTVDQVWKVKIRCASATADEEQMLLQAYNAIGQIRTFNNKTTPTNAEVLAEVKLLGNSVIKLIQRQLGDYTL